jgi:hypothetical protein
MIESETSQLKPALKRIADPAGKGIGRPKGGVTIGAAAALGSVEPDEGR